MERQQLYVLVAQNLAGVAAGVYTGQTAWVPFHSTRSRYIDRCFLKFDLPIRMRDEQKRTREKEFIVVHNSYEDQPIDRTLGVYQDETDLFPSTAATTQNEGSVPEKPVHSNRRRFISLLAIGTVGVVTAVTVGGVTFAREIDGWTHGTDGSIIAERGDDGEGVRKGIRRGKHQHPRPQKTPSPSQSPTPSPKQTPTPQPTTAPQPTPTSAPTGTVVGKTSQATNTAVAFTNPADGQASWLVHMSNGNFVAVEQACTHAGVAVKYNPSTGQFNCPAHGAIFNADGTNPQAPATRPLPPVHVTVNANGTITTP